MLHFQYTDSQRVKCVRYNLKIFAKIFTGAYYTFIYVTNLGVERTYYVNQRHYRRRKCVRELQNTVFLGGELARPSSKSYNTRYNNIR